MLPFRSEASNPFSRLLRWLNKCKLPRSLQYLIVNCEPTVYFTATIHSSSLARTQQQVRCSNRVLCSQIIDRSGIETQQAHTHPTTKNYSKRTRWHATSWFPPAQPPHKMTREASCCSERRECFVAPDPWIISSQIPPSHNKWNTREVDAKTDDPWDEPLALQRGSLQPPWYQSDGKARNRAPAIRLLLNQESEATAR